MRDGFFSALLGSIARKIGDLAAGLRARISAFIRGKRKVSGKDLLKELRTFDAPYLEAMADAMTTVTGERITAKDLREYVIGEVGLSDRLYHQARETSARVQRILEEHTRYAHDARKLALDLYEGYGFRDQETLVPKVRLPRYLDDAVLNGEMDALLARIQAAQLKTAPLRAAYLQALDAILKDKGQKAIDKALDVAVQERYRYFANRIAQTELARAQNAQIARELMADDEVQVVQVVLSASHPAPDMCDVFARQNAWGLGAGCYPKAHAPLAPYHPHCRCSLLQRRDLSAANAKHDPEAAMKYLFGLDPKVAGRVAGSRAKRDQVMQGGGWEDMLNEGRPKAYRIGKAGETTHESALRSEEIAAQAGDIASVDLGPLHNPARSEVIEKGRATGKEHGVAVLSDGTRVSFGGEFENKIQVPRFDAPDGSVTVHHNHPTGDTFSRADVKILLERAELGRVDAHGHAGGWSSMERIGGALSPAMSVILVEEAMSQARALMHRAVKRYQISQETAQAGLWQVVMSLLLERQGVIRYALNSESVRTLANKVIDE